MRFGKRTLWLLALPSMALLECGAHQYFRHSAPNQADWERLAPAIIALYRPGDLVTVSPSWAAPILRHVVGNERMPIEILGRSDDDALTRVIAVAFSGAKAEEFSGFIEQGRRRVGPFSLRLLENPHPAIPRMRLIERVHPEHLRVFEGPPEHPVACSYTASARPSAGNLGGDPTFGAHRFACPSGEPHLVTVTTIDDQTFAPRRCIWAHPSGQGPLTMRFSDVWLGDELVGHAGLPWLLSRDGAGTPIVVDAQFDGHPIGHALVRDTDGWMRWEWSTGGERDRRGELTLVISSERPQNRRFCFTLESR